MLTVNDKIISRSDLCKQFGIDYDKIAKRPQFEGTQGWKDHANGGKKKFNAGYSKPARFWVEDKATQLPLEIRYAQSRRFSKDVDAYLYEPKRVVFSGEGMQLSEDLDLAVFAYMHPSCALSPFSKGQKSNFEFIDVQARADKKISDLDALGEAIVHAKNISGTNAIILAKGLGIAGVEQMASREVNAALMEYASKNPAVYLQKKNQQLTMIEGKIEHFIDKGIFHLDQIGQVRRWSWTKGEREGQVIIDIVNTTANARESLKNEIKSHLDDYMYLLNNIGDTVSANDAALAALERMTDDAGQVIGNSLPAHLANIGKNGEMPENFNDATTFLTRVLGKRTTNPNIAKFLAAVKEGLTEDGVDAWLELNNITKAV